MATFVHLGILGPLRVWCDGREVKVTRRERVLLAMLLLQPNRPVEVARLVEAIWGDAPPRAARSRLQSCVARLRKQLAGHRVPCSIVTGPAGYLLDVDEQVVDLPVFHRRLAEARAAVGRDDLSAAQAAYRAALGLWRGPALGGVESSLVRKVATALTEERVRALEERIDVELRLGAAGDLVAELTELVAEFPYQERLHGALMVALYRAGRQTDALAAYQRVRKLLVAEVGTEPGADLRDLHQRILSSDQALLATSPAPKPANQAAACHSLPRAVADFTGRSEAVARLLDLSHPGSGTLTVVAIDGMAGVGKTTLAVHVAHLLAKHYPDAQLYLDLHGHSERDPVEPAAALEALLRQLGVPGGRVPTGLEDRAALWRSELAQLTSRSSSGVLVVLDNAAATAQVTPLLPAGAGCLVLVTSRRRLTGLDSARPVSLDPLLPEDAVALLAEVAGERVRAEPDAAAEVVTRCGHLPLAIRLAGARLAHRPTWRVRDLADRLGDAHSLLTELAVEDRTVADAFALSYAPLPPDLQRAFRLLGVHPGDEFDAYALAALADTDLADAQRLLEALVDRHLVMEVRPGRYRFHDLVREYSRHLTGAHDREPDRAAAVARLLDLYLHTAASITLPLEPVDDSRRNVRFGDPLLPALVADATAEGIVRLEAERPNLVSAVELAVAAGMDRYVWQLARSTWWFLYHRGLAEDACHSSSWAVSRREARRCIRDGSDAQLPRIWLRHDR
jgi:DNA-binding SARP family transcriptional activator